MLGIINTLVTSVVERRRELATLQALGGSQGQVTALILWEAGYLGLLGTGMGVVGGLAGSYSESGSSTGSQSVSLDDSRWPIRMGPGGQPWP